LSLSSSNIVQHSSSVKYVLETAPVSKMALNLSIRSHIFGMV
jgi:hypothetical protein